MPTDTLNTVYETDNGNGDPAVTMRTHPTGTYFNLLAPNPDDIWLVDIAHGLAHINRFNGATAHPYSVAEHCLAVSTQVERRTGDKQLALAALLHDAAEAYIGDMNGLLKKSYVGDMFRSIEDDIERAIEQRFGLPLDILRRPVIKAADKEAFDWECAMVRDAKHRHPAHPEDVRRAYEARITELCDFVLCVRVWSS